MGRKQQTEVGPKETVQPRRSSRRKRANDDEDQPKVSQGCVGVSVIRGFRYVFSQKRQRQQSIRSQKVSNRKRFELRDEPEVVQQQNSPDQNPVPRRDRPRNEK